MTIKDIGMSKDWSPRIIEGGKGGILLPTDPDWLWDIPVGTVFFCKKKDTPIFLQLFIVTAKKEEDNRRFMRLENPENPEQHLSVDTKDFSRSFTYHMTLAGVEDGSSDSLPEE